MTVPADLRKRIRERLWAAADELDWMYLTTSDKAQQYDHWVRDPQIGGQLARYIDASQVRVYVKDSLLKGYTTAQLADEERPLRVLRITTNVTVIEKYTKPHGCRLKDGRMVAWGKASEWKAILMALHERVWSDEARAFGAVFFNALGKYSESSAREMVEDAAKRLGVEHVVWLET